MDIIMIRSKIFRGLLAVLLAYLVLIIMLAAFQRALIYHPMGPCRIEPEDLDFPRGQVHRVQVTAHDGLKLNGWIVLADGLRAADQGECDRQLGGGRLTVVYFSGNAGNRVYRGPEVGLLTGRGVNVCLVDYRGYGDNPGKPSEEDLARDAHSVWEYMTKQRNVPAHRLVLYGESLGGAVAVRLAEQCCREGSPPAGIVLRSTFNSLVDVASYHYPWLPVRWALIERYPSEQRIAHVTCPVLQIHGSDDTIVPIRLARRLFEAVPPTAANGTAKEWVAIFGADHNDVVLVAEKDMKAALDRFFRRAVIPKEPTFPPHSDS
jgi:fermentation-respiration switch protein FrsA (DUF1100 family)